MGEDGGSAAVADRRRRRTSGIWLGVIGLVMAGLSTALVHLSNHLLWPIASDPLTGQVHYAAVAPLGSYLLSWSILPIGAGIIALVMGVCAQVSKSNTTARRARSLGIVAVSVDLVLMLLIVNSTIYGYDRDRSTCAVNPDWSSCHVGENSGQVRASSVGSYALVNLKTEEGTFEDIVRSSDSRSVWTQGSWIEATVTSGSGDPEGDVVSCQLYWNGHTVDTQQSRDGTVTCQYHVPGSPNPGEQE